MEETVRVLQDRVNRALLGADWQTRDELVAPDAWIGPKDPYQDKRTPLNAR
jgi:hypothetical protein